jgi:hypothetical protein
MAYTINTTDGTIFATVADGTINTTSSLTLVGKNYAGYGEFLNENVLKLLESGANTTQPSAPLTGQLWFDKSAAVLKVYNGTLFKNLGSATASGSQPTSVVAGDLWFDSTNAQLKVYDGSAFILVGPSFTAGSGTTGAIVDTIEDNVAVDHVVVKMFVEDEIVAMVSKDATFTPGAAVTGFATIGPGIQLSTAVSNAVFKGDATNAQTLDNLDSTDFLSAVGNDTTSGTLGVLNDTGLAVGVDSDLRVSVSGSDVTVQNQTSDGDVILRVNDGGVATTVATLDGATATLQMSADILNAQADGVGNIGSSTVGFNTIHAKATSAQYADLAERFEADVAYPAGTVVELGGAKEVTVAQQDLTDAVFGVISTQAAYLMNGSAGSNETHPPIAMSGRVPVRVVGAVKKGDRLVSAGNGIARSAKQGEANAFNVIGRALETKSSAKEGTVEAIVTISS